jgi:hypothetical protein
MATTFPGAPSRTSSTNSNTVRQGIPTTMQLVALARAWERIGMLLTALAVVAKQVGSSAAAPADLCCPVGSQHVPGTHTASNVHACPHT